MDETSQAIGHMQAQIATLEREVKELRDQVAKLVAVLNAGKGGWRAIILVGTVATSLGAVATKVADYVLK
jgi:hypothetical protein